ncbi:hypothetical protein LguiA_036652 [Lonicera macranthoides]
MEMEIAMAQKNSTNTVGVKVGVVLDMDTWLGKIGLSCISMALTDFYASHSHYKTRLLINTRHVPSSDVVAAASAAVDLVKNVEVQAIIGPSTSMQANFILDLGDKANVPIISFSATSPSLSTIRNPYFIRATQNDSSQVKTISAIVKAFGWRTVVPIYVENDFGQGIIPFLTDGFQDIDVRVPYRSIISPLATDDQILAELYKLMTMQTRVFVVHMWSNLGSRFFTKAKEIGMMEEGYVWIITDGLADILSSMDPSVIDSMQGILGVKPYVPVTKQRTNFTARWKRKFQQENPSVLDAEMNVFGLWAYDAAVALAMAVEKVRPTKFGFEKANISSTSTDLDTFGVSTSGPELLQVLNSTTFRGLSGDFRIVEGQLQSSPYQIINVINKSGRGIGFWTERYGITRVLNFSSTIAYSTSKDNLRAIIWPGETTTPPRGWVIPTNGKRLKIGVPVKDGFSEFVKVTRNPDGDTSEFTGYCIAVFDAVMAALPYDVSYDYFPFEKSDGTSRGTYNDLVYQVYAGEYDAVVGDTTIVANRSNYVDFTLPYTESGVSLIVPIKDNRRKNAWVFLKPLTWDLWVTSFCSFVFIGFVIWILEHRINEDFRGPPSHQVGMIFYFSFSTMVFAHKERVLSNLARFVLIIWVFVVLILSQSYTASLTSMLTVQQLQPTVTDMKELVKNRENVGYQQGSFALGLLKRMGFLEANLKVYNAPEECHSLFSNGSIVAAFDEIPYTRLFLAKYCSKYTMVFPRGSPLVPDVSRAVLNVTEGEKMVEIEKAWLGQQTSCPDTSTSLTSNSLGLESFWGLFLIAFVASISALIIYMVVFLYEHWHILRHLEPKTSFWEKIVVLATHLDKKDINSHTFRRTELHDGNGTPRADRACLVEPSPNATYSPNNNGPPSPSTFSNDTEGKFAVHVEQGSPSRDYSDQDTLAQTAPEIVQEIELTVPTQDRSRTSESTNRNL